MFRHAASPLPAPTRRAPLAALIPLFCSCAAAALTPRGRRERRAGHRGIARHADQRLRVVIVRNALAPVVATSVNYLVGSEKAPVGFPGTAQPWST